MRVRYAAGRGAGKGSPARESDLLNPDSSARTGSSPDSTPASSAGARVGKRPGGGEDRAALPPSPDGDFASGVPGGPQPAGENGVREDMASLASVAVSSAHAAGLPLSSSAPAEAGAQEAAQPDGTLSDAELMLRVRAGDDSCFDYLIQKYRRPIMHFMFRMVHNQAVAEELAQEVFLRVYRSRETYRAEAKFSTWLYRIATNLGVNYARDTKHERAARNIYLDAPDEETGTLPELADGTPSVEQDLVREERMRAIRAHVMALPERQRTAVLMHKYQGMDYKEIGAVLRLSESATKSLLFRAYQTLRERLKEFA